MVAGDPSAAAAGDVSPVTSFSLSPTPSAASLSQIIDQLATRQPLLETPVPPNPSKPSPPPTQAFDSGATAASDDAAATVSDVLGAAAAASPRPLMEATATTRRDRMRRPGPRRSCFARCTRSSRARPRTRWPLTHSRSCSRNL